MPDEKDLQITENQDGTLTIHDPEDGGSGPDTEQNGQDNQEGGDDSAEHHADDADDDASDDASDDADDNEEGDTAPSKTEENRRKRADRKARIRERNERVQRELAARDAQIAELTNRLAMVERKSSGTELASIDAEIKKTADSYGYYKQQIALAHGQENAGEIIADATEKMLLAQRRFEDLNRVKAGYVQRQNQGAPIDPRVLNYGQQWIARNSWYTEGGQDSSIAMAIDNAMAAEGFVPTTEVYWKELDNRLKKVLPHRYKRDKITGSDEKPHRSVVTGSGRESRGSGNPGGGYTLSAERVTALKEAGMWDDVKVRNEMIRRYREQDRKAAQR